MYRKLRKRGSTETLDLDSLMDILSCEVGVMLFLVIYTVLQLGSTSFQLAVPTPIAPPEDSKRVVILCNNGTVRVIDTSGPLRELLAGLEIITYSDIPAFVRQANQRPPFDQYFRYRLDYVERAIALGGRTRAFEVEIQELPGAVGDSIHQLDDGSTYVALLDALDAGDTWLAFAVDSMSLNVFRRARLLASERGFATTWDPFTLDFPTTFAVAADGSGGGPTPRDALSKPPR